MNFKLIHRIEGLVSRRDEIEFTYSVQGMTKALLNEGLDEKDINEYLGVKLEGLIKELTNKN